jgi:outer membrane protein assembly factor BamB
VYEGGIHERFNVVLMTNFGDKVVASNGRTLYGLSGNGTVLWTYEPPDGVASFDISSSGDYAAVGSAHFVYLIHEGKEVGRMFTGGKVASVAMSATGRYLAVGNVLGDVMLYDCEVKSH